tara:strand:- start:430 stop:618 length:189 start_codon:yes stop_codon:yes gene_type:complete
MYESVLSFDKTESVPKAKNKLTIKATHNKNRFLIIIKITDNFDISEAFVIHIIYCTFKVLLN